MRSSLLTRGSDYVGVWAKAHPQIFGAKGENAERVPTILAVPDQRLVSPSAPRGTEEGDPWVIAMAQGLQAQPPELFRSVEAIVVTEETKIGGVREVCGALGVPCTDFVGMLAAEGVIIAITSTVSVEESPT
jgi:hypothetical protein